VTQASILDTAKQRRRYRPLTPGPNQGARKLFSIYYGNDGDLREQVIGSIAALKVGSPDPRQRALALIGGWATGKSCPVYKFRKVLLDVAGIELGSWDEEGVGVQ
jgi:hypothetical protein